MDGLTKAKHTHSMDKCSAGTKKIVGKSAQDSKTADATYQVGTSWCEDFKPAVAHVHTTVLCWTKQRQNLSPHHVSDASSELFLHDGFCEAQSKNIPQVKPLVFL